MTTSPPLELPAPLSAAAAPAPHQLPARALDRLAGWLDVFSSAAVRIARVGAAVATLVAAGAIVVNVFTRYVLGWSIEGSDELANFAFLWAIWMGGSLAVKYGAIVHITLLCERGPAWWRRSVKAFSGLSLGLLLAYCCVRSTQYAMLQGESLGTASPGLQVPYFYAISSMAVGYYFITLHYLSGVAGGAVRLAGRGRGGGAGREVLLGLAGALACGAVLWAACYVLLSVGASKLVVLGLIFVALTLAGTPIVFMLSIVGILSTMSFLGLTFYPAVGSDPIFPFRTTQTTMGLTGATELIVILMFLVVGEVMNASGMSNRVIRFAAACVGHLRGGMAYVCQLTSALVSGISGAAVADASIMTPLLVPAMEKEGYPRDVAAAVVAGASIKGPIGPISIMFIVYGYIVTGVSISALLLSGLMAEILLLVFQAGTVYVVVRRMGVLQKRRFAGLGAVARSGLSTLPVAIVPVIILGGILSGACTVTESASVAFFAVIALALLWYGTLAPRDLPRSLIRGATECGIVMLLLGDSAILAKVLYIDRFGDTLGHFLTGLTSDKYVFLLLVNVLLLAVGIFIEPLPALYILAPVLAPISLLYGIDPVQFGLIMVFNLVLALIHPPIGLVLFVVSGLARVSVERLSIVILPWLAVSLVVLFLVTYLPSQAVLVFSNLFA